MQTLLPHNSTQMEQALEVTIREGLQTPVHVDRLWSPSSCPEPILPFLAWALSVDGWDAQWPVETKRNVIASSVFIHRHKGTAGALKRALAALGLGVEISEWFEYGGDPYHFRADVKVYDRGITAKEIDSILSAIQMAKNARSYLEALRVYMSPPPVKTFMGGAVRSGRTIRCYAYVPRIPPQNTVTYHGGATHTIRRIKLGAAL